MARLSFRGGHGPRRGQALIVAVLVLFAVATLAALFTAIIGAQLAQVSRHSDVVRLRNITQAGLWLANEQLTYSIKGADWRPRKTPYLFGGGQIQLRVAYWPPLDVVAPAPSQQKGRFVQIVSTAIFPDYPFLRYTMVARKPLLLTDYARFITDRNETNRPARLGVEGLELGALQRDDYVFYIDGPVRSNTHLISYGVSRLFLHTWDEVAEGTSTWADMKILRDDRIEIAGSLLPEPNHPVLDRGTDELQLIVNGETRIADLFVPQTPEQEEDYALGFADWWDPSPVLNSRVLANLPGYWTLEGMDVEGPALAISRVQPPEVDAPHPDTQRKRYLLLTKESGRWLRDELGQDYNTGEYGWGWTNFGGIYIDNFSDIQYGHDLEVLQRNWLASVGHHDTGYPLGDERADEDPGWDPDDGPPKGPADWWDKTGRYYGPPGVEIVLHGDETCPYLEIIRHDDPDQNGLYWKDEYGDPTAGYSYAPWAGGQVACWPTLTLGIDAATAIFPFPPNGVIYAEGNVRIRGIMPGVRDVQSRAEGDLIYLPYLDDDHAEGMGRSRRFDLQVVSGGTIYVEGDLLSPASAGLIDNTYSTDRIYGSRLALLARDYVCLNTTALNPRPVELFQAVPDTDVDYVYNDRYPNYPPGAHPRHLFFQGPEGDTGWDDPSLRDTDPNDIEFVYQNVRLLNDFLADELSDLRLIIGHSGWYAPGGTTGDPDEPPGPTTGDNEAGVEVALAVENAAGTTSYLWESLTNAYTFRRTAAAAPGSADESDHWYTDSDNAEFLPNEYQFMVMHDPIAGTRYLSGNDIIRFSSRVEPIEHRTDGNPDGWEVAPDELAYILGPLAVAPPRTADPLPVRIDAMIYAQNGSWFLIPGPWFTEDPDEGDYTREYPGYREPLNIQISSYGAITENMPADVGAAAEWTSKWGGPLGEGAQLFLSHQYDPLLRWPRWDPESETWAPRFPNLPMTADMLIWGERVSGQAGG